MSCSRSGTQGNHAVRALRHMISSLVCLGRKTITGQLATAGRQFDDWTADYRLYSNERADPRRMFARLQNEAVQMLPADAPVVVALDDTRLRKWSRRTPGVGYARDPLGPKFQVNLMLAQRFVQLSLAITDGRGRARMVPADFVHAPAPAKPAHNAPAESFSEYRQAMRRQSLGAVGARSLCEMRRNLDSEAAGRGRRLIGVVDGGYTNRRFLSGLPDDCTVIGRIRSDAKLYHLPTEQPERGRRRVYGPEAPTPEELRRDEGVPWREIQVVIGDRQCRMRVKTMAPLRWRATGAGHDLRVVVIAPLKYRVTGNGRYLYRKPAYLICTDPELAVEEIVQSYVWRWGIEVNFRDEKTLIGVGEAEVHHPSSVERVPAMQVLSYAVLLLSAIRTYGMHDMQLTLPAPRWQNIKPKQASPQQLINQLRHDLWNERLHLSNFASTSTPDTKSLKLPESPASALFYGAARA